MFLVSTCSCLCPIQWSQVLSREWRCSWSSADRRCSNYICVIDNFIAHQGATYIRDLTVSNFQANISAWWLRCLLQIALGWMSLYLTDDTSILVQVMVAIKTILLQPMLTLICVSRPQWTNAMIVSAYMIYRQEVISKFRFLPLSWPLKAFHVFSSPLSRSK